MRPQRVRMCEVIQGLQLPSLHDLSQQKLISHWSNAGKLQLCAPSPPLEAKLMEKPPLWILLDAETEGEGALEGLTLAINCLAWKWHLWLLLTAHWSDSHDLPQWQEVWPTMCLGGGGQEIFGDQLCDNHDSLVSSPHSSQDPFSYRWYSHSAAWNPLMVSHDTQIKIQNHHPGLQGLLTSSISNSAPSILASCSFLPKPATSSDLSTCSPPGIPRAHSPCPSVC